MPTEYGPGFEKSIGSDVDDFEEEPPQAAAPAMSMKHSASTPRSDVDGRVELRIESPDSRTVRSSPKHRQPLLGSLGPEHKICMAGFAH